MAYEVSVQEQKTEQGWNFLVAVSENGSLTKHVVHVTQDAFDRLVSGKEVAPAELVKKSFEFLLEQEPKESILGEFDLPIIGNYFPEYEEEIRKRI